MALPNDFFTTQSMLTLTGASGITFVISNTIQRVFDYNPKWLALAVAIIVAILGVYLSKGSGSDYVIGLINGFLIYCTAVGATAAVGSAPPQAGVSKGIAAAAEPNIPSAKRKFLTRWY